MTPRGKPPSGAWEADFQKAFDEGRFRQAAEIFSSSGESSTRIELMLDVATAQLVIDPAVSLRLLTALKVPAGRPIDRVKRLALLAEAYGRTRAFDAADEHLEAALKIAKSLRDDDLIAQVGYRLVRRYLLEENFEKARAALEIAKKGSSFESRVRVLYAEAVILDGEERFTELADRLIELLKLLDPNLWPPPWPGYIPMRAFSTALLAFVAMELYVPQAVPHIERHLNGIAWWDDYGEDLFITLSNVAWAVARQGDYFKAFRYLKRASAVAPKAWGVVAACDRALLARCFGQQGWSRVELDEAEQIAAEVNWYNTPGDERNGLLLIAELFAEIDPARSSMYLAQYRSLGQSKMYMRRGARLHRVALQRATGIVELALGNRARGLASLREAREIVEQVGFDFEVALCLAAEYRATGDRDLLPAMQERLRNYPQSWLAKEVSLRIEAPKPLLSTMQQAVFEELCEGKTTAQIAKSLGRSEYTVNNHIREIFKAYGVKSRAALVAKAARQGLVKPDSPEPK